MDNITENKVESATDANVGKKFRHKRLKAEYTISEFLPRFDFGSLGRHDAYKFQRSGSGATAIRPVKQLEVEFEPVEGN